MNTSDAFVNKKVEKLKVRLSDVSDYLPIRLNADSKSQKQKQTWTRNWCQAVL